MSSLGGSWTLRRQLGVGLAGLAVLAVVVAVLAASRPVRHGGVGLIRVERSDFVRRVRVEGHLEAVRATPILVPSEVRQGYQIAWLAPEGVTVAESEPVVRFDPSELEKGAADARAALRTTELEIVKRSTTAEATAVNLERDVELAEEELEAVEIFQKRDETIYSRSESVEAEVDVELAAKRRNHAETSRETNQALSGTELDLLAIERRESSRRLERTAKALGLLEVVAPHGGLLVVERDWQGQPMRVGNTVYSGQKIAELPDFSEMKAEVFVLEADAGGLEVGQEARVVVESAPDQVFPARVSRVDSLAKPRLRGSPVQFFGATLELEATDPEVMRLGQRVSAEILISDLEGVLVVPRQAVVERDDGHFVFKKRGARFEEVAIQPGVLGLGRMVVDEGLAEGDLIAARDPGLAVERIAPTAEGRGAAQTAASAGGGR